MKKTTLLLFAITLFSFSTQAQVLLTENSTALTVGNIASDLTGTTAGQGGWLTYVATGGANSDFQVVNQGGAYGNALRVTGSNTAANTRYLFKDLAAAWTARTPGNNIAEADYDFFTGPATTSLNSMRVAFYDGSGAKILGGLRITLNTMAITGLAYYDNAGTLGNYSFNLGAAGAVVTLAPNTWYKLGFSFNKTTGEIKFKESTGLFSGSVMGAGTGTDISEIDLFAATATGNTLAGNGIYDNINVKASSTDTLLGVSSNEIVANKFSVYPNPAKNVITISNNENILINEITISDLNGRIVKHLNSAEISENQINVSDLESGMYMMNIQSDKGSLIKKFIKN
ncbi:T9SS type A sorting domain-containing protein [Flavobacterium sp. GT3R68]|uniref:T9SS type A sorting domain-containing protein n=1 Tax=Flavobacterium sp. GT3R68 TaxID=2594437 RepID=UPI000F86AE02|nr:T9SS type A sorting domain-containing protein [Flavobacterium sp. GT3R68]RTY93626.1 T9SS type A sorting domain-containing protein [Flavobacterium sp. GSN2]TRW91653.1 T9SS type A sorting domain-containing protein [Flavobacterium sp. GT3R68]